VGTVFGYWFHNIIHHRVTTFAEEYEIKKDKKWKILFWPEGNPKI